MIVTEEDKRFDVAPLTQQRIDEIAERMCRVMDTSIEEGASRDQCKLWMRTALFRMLIRGSSR